jgi:peptide/nickel transport system permease protein
MAEPLILADRPALVRGPTAPPRRIVAWALMGLAVVACVAGLIIVSDINWAGFTLLGLSFVLAFSSVTRLLPNRDVVMYTAAGWVILVTVLAIIAPLLPLSEHEDAAKTLAVPAYQSPALTWPHPLGTNAFGLDLLARVIYGARISLVTGVSAAFIGFAIGGLIGLIAGYAGGAADRTVTIFTDVILAFPGIILLIALASALDRGVPSSILGLAILGIPTNIRLSRANALAFKQRDFVTAARVVGASRKRIVFREVLPNVVTSMLAYFFVVVAVLIVAEASLSFLGLGVQQPTPTWGNMIAEGDGGVFERHPQIVLVPGIAVFLTVLSLNLLGERFKARLEGGAYALEGAA